MDTNMNGGAFNPEYYANEPRPAAGHASSDYQHGALIFVHAPRTAGSTLSRIMDWEYAPLEICDVDGRFYYWSVQKISGWPKERLGKMRLFKGHMPFGLHRHVPQPARYITLLRDPVDRTASEYYGRRYRHTHPIADRDAKLQSFEEYVKTVPYGNPQTKAIAGVQCVYEYHWYTVIPSYRVYCGPCTVETLEIAKKNLSLYFDLVGLTERFEETLALAKLMFGWKVPYYTAAREGVRRPKRDEISSRQRDVVAKYHEFDMELYRYGVSLFEQAVANYGDRLGVACNEIRKASKPSAARSRYYNIRSFARRHFIRTHCALQ